MARTFVRTLSTLATSLLLLALTALPALASGGTKPDPAVDPYAIGSMQQLGTAALVGIGIGVLAFLLLGKDTSHADDH